MDGSLLTLKDVGQYLRLSRGTVQSLIGSGQLPSIKIGRARRVSPEALKQYLVDTTTNAA